MTKKEFCDAVERACLFDPTTDTMTVFRDIVDTLYKDPANPFPPAHEYMRDAYAEYIRVFGSKRSVNGHVFELIFCCLLIQKGIVPFIKETEISLVPGTKFDVVLYALDDPEFSKLYGKLTPEEQKKGYDKYKNHHVRVKPICISLKTSGRERVKQADLEAFALKNVHRHAECYLVMRDKTECSRTNKKIVDRACMGLDQAICAEDKKFDDFVAYVLGKYVYVIPKPMPVYQSGKEYRG